MIQEDYVSFEIAKLLKEKGFDEPTVFRYDDYPDNNHLLFAPSGAPIIKNSETQPYFYSAPTLQMAMKWLRKVHKLDIDVSIEYKNSKKVYYYSVLKKTVIRDIDCLHSETNFDSYEEACEAAIKYCLENLVKNEDGEKEYGIPVPKTVKEAISTLEKILSDEDREYLLKNGAISMHHSLGTWIRNEWGLWTGSELKNELKKKGFEHPDDMSNYIIEEFIKYWNNKL